ncbi:MAG: phosphoribosylamine--glycine ligase [Gammaproteobacteria bacterium]|nr:phosphoribosylamine--glycine ligase [Gammaproteobacteria bacterium]
MKILIIGSGGREHTLAWKAAQSAGIEKVYVAPGNAGTAQEPQVENVPIAAGDIEGLTAFAIEHDIRLTIVGPEAPLVAGIVDTFQSQKLPIFGPSRGAAQLEGSKSFTKDFLERHNIPTAAYAAFTDPQQAINYVRSQGTPIVVKADGLAAGKGVILAQTEDQAITAIREMLRDNTFGEAGKRIIIEEFLRGEEASFICMVDGKHVLPMATSQDHKSRDNADTGPNTGGMGAYSPAPVVTGQVYDRIMAEVIEPTVRGMEAEGYPYQGFLYAGLMISNDGTLKVLEFNCRFGDPEAQPILLRLKSDLISLCLAALQGKLNTVTAHWDPRPSVGVVLASGGYPGHYQKGKKISGLAHADPEFTKIFHAGTVLKNHQVLTNGGRVICVTSLGESVSEAQRRAYAAVDKIHFDEMYYRTDIAYRAIARERETR